MKWFVGLFATVVLGLGVSGCVARVRPVGHHHSAVVWRPVVGHVHSHECGHYHYRGEWYHHAGHVHRDGCGHVHRGGIWVVVD